MTRQELAEKIAYDVTLQFALAQDWKSSTKNDINARQIFERYDAVYSSLSNYINKHPDSPQQLEYSQ